MGLFNLMLGCRINEFVGASFLFLLYGFRLGRLVRYILNVTNVLPVSEVGDVHFKCNLCVDGFGSFGTYILNVTNRLTVSEDF